MAKLHCLPVHVISNIACCHTTFMRRQLQTCMTGDTVDLFLGEVDARRVPRYSAHISAEDELLQGVACPAYEAASFEESELLEELDEAVSAAPCLEHLAHMATGPNILSGSVSSLVTACGHLFHCHPHRANFGN